MNDVQTNDRGEYTLDGKLYHQVIPAPHTGEPVAVAHEGAWLNCDGCNPVVVVQADDKGTGGLPGTELAELRAEYGEAKKAEREAKERAATATAKLKAALAEASGNALRSALHVPGFKPVTLTYTEPWQFDMDALKAAEPATYVRYAQKKPNGQWTLAESRGA